MIRPESVIGMNHSNQDQNKQFYSNFKCYGEEEVSMYSWNTFRESILGVKIKKKMCAEISIKNYLLSC